MLKIVIGGAVMALGQWGFMRATNASGMGLAVALMMVGIAAITLGIVRPRRA